MTPQRLREIAALLIEDANFRRRTVAGAEVELKARGQVSQAPGVDAGRVKAGLKEMTQEADARMAAAHELQEWSFQMKGDGRRA